MACETTSKTKDVSDNCAITLKNKEFDAIYRCKYNVFSSILTDL
jgi:hypothetical protein